MKTLLTALSLFIASFSFAQKDTSSYIYLSGDGAHNGLCCGHWEDSIPKHMIIQNNSCWNDMMIHYGHGDLGRWNQELKDGKITARDFETLKVGDFDLAKMDSLKRVYEDSVFESGTKEETFEMVKLKDRGIRQIGKGRYALQPHLLKATIQEFSIKPLFEKKDLLIYSLQFIAGAADGMNQALVYHHALAGHPFWDYNTSWKRKYKDYDHGDMRAAFPGSKTWAVGITDGNHLTRMINRSFSLGSVMIAMSKGERWSEIIKEIVISSLINRLGFTLVYDHILK